MIRSSSVSDLAEIRKIHTQAFGADEGPVIAKLVDDLLKDETAMPLLSLVAAQNHKLVGHILFTNAVITGTEKPISTQILAPLAILPGAQNRGVGAQLIIEGLRILKESGTELVFVLGHPGYYPRCGFIPALVQGFEAPYPIPEENTDAWMVQGLVDGILENNSGKVQCSKVLNAPQHWRE